MLATILVWTHIAAGIVALLTFAVPLVVQKGNRTHRRIGWIYVYAMAVAAFTAIAVMPIRLIQRPREGWPNPIFLAYVGLMSLTAASYGVRILRQKKRTTAHPLSFDWVLPILLVVSSIAIVIYAIEIDFMLALAFAPLGILTALPQIRTMRAAPTRKAWWITEHLTAMGVSCVATVTAFLVTNAGRVMSEVPTIVWLAPSIVLLPLIAMWRRRYRK